MRRWPATIRVFLDYSMNCVGCPIACFHTVEDACGEYDIDLPRFLETLKMAVARSNRKQSIAKYGSPA